MDSAPIEEGKLAEEVFHNDERTINFGEHVLDAVRRGNFVKKPDMVEEIKDYAEVVRKCLDELTEMFSEDGLEFYVASIKVVEKQIETLKNLMKCVRSDSIKSFSGNLLRLAGTLTYAHPYGRAAFWTGFLLSNFSDVFASRRRGEVEKLASNIANLFKNDRVKFARLARAIQKLDAVIQNNTGWSLYDENFREFLRGAGENLPMPVHEITLPDDNVIRRGAVMELAQNQAIIELLGYVVEAVQREDIGALNVMTASFHAISHLQNTPEEAAAYQLGEVALRGLVLFLEYKQNETTLDNFSRGVQRMRKEYEALCRVYGPAQDEATPE